MSACSLNRPFRTAILGGVLVAVVAVVCASDAPAQSIRVVEPLSGAVESQAIAVSANGGIVTGNSDPFGPGPGQALRWTRNGGSTDAGMLAGGADMWGLAISGDGATVVGIAFPFVLAPTRAYRVRNGIVEDIGKLPGAVGGAEAYGVSFDGSAVAGTSSTANDSWHAFRWTRRGMQDLGTLPGGGYSFGSAISADGMTVVGTSGTGVSEHAFRWTARRGMEDLGALSADEPSGGFAVSADGKDIAGYSGVQAVRWHGNGNQLQGLGLLPGGTFSVGYSISGNGKVVGGAGDNADGAFVATLWTQQLGLVELHTYLPTQGIDLTGWELEATAGLSADGSTLVGVGRFNGASRGWVVTLPRRGRDCGDDDNDHGMGSSNANGNGHGNGGRH